MKVTELNREQLDELRWDYNYNINGSTAYPDEVADEQLFDYYAGIEFVPDDFCITENAPIGWSKRIS